MTTSEELHHRLEQASVFFAHLVDILLEFLLRFLVGHRDVLLLAKQIRHLGSLTLAHMLYEMASV